MLNMITILLAIISFISPIFYKYSKGNTILLSDLAKCTLAGMGLPNLVICLYLLITDPASAIEMKEAPQYLTIAVLIIIYLAIEEIKKIFHIEKKDL